MVICTALAAQEPWCEPGSAHGYHVNTDGSLAGELVRRATGRGVGQRWQTPRATRIIDAL